MAWVLSEQAGTSALVEPIPLQDLKDALRIDYDYDDFFLTETLAAAREYLEGWMGVTLAQRGFLWISDEAPGLDELCLPVWPIQDITEITYFDADNALQTFDAANYEVNLVSRPARVRLVSGAAWPVVYARYDALTITLVAGLVGSTHVMPQRALQVLRLLVADLYEHREAQLEARIADNQQFKRLLWSIREVKFY